MATGRSRNYGGVPKWQIQFPEGSQYIPCDQLEEVAAEEDALDLFQRGRLGDELDLRLTLTHARLTGRLADVIYSMDVTGTDFYAHQFKPVVRLLNSVTRGILIADEVGLGKTIEAGLVWTELRTRYDFRRLLVLCPAVLREKWQRELRTRFGVAAELLDAKGMLARLRQAGGARTEGFAVVASLQGLRPRRGWKEGTDTHHASELARFLESEQESQPLVDLCVIDEAHHLRNRETMTSQLGRLARSVSDYIVLLTATPIHLRNNDLYELLRLVDEGMFERGQSFSEILEANGPLVQAREIVTSHGKAGSSAAGSCLEVLLRMARRNPLLRDNRQLKRLVEERIWEQDFSLAANVARVAERLDRVNLLGYAVTRTRRREVEERRVIREVLAEKVPPKPAEERFYRAVTELVREYCMKGDVNAAFLEVTPQRQMSSSMPAALRLWQQGGASGHEALDEWEDDDRPLRAALVARARELGDLDALWEGDSKYERFRAELLGWFEKREGEKVIVFSAFLATLDYLEERLEEDGIPAMALRGATLDKDRTVEEFRRCRRVHVLLSSEVGSEGIDLQFARAVINYDLPWNPMRVEQRIGRVDRLGQRAQKIHVWNLFYGNTIDARIYDRLFARLNVFEGTLGGLEPVVGEMVQDLRRRLFTSQLSAEEEVKLIDQTRAALAIRRQEEEKLEQEAAHLTAYGDYILRQVRAARDLHRSISAEDLLAYVTDFVGLHYRGSEFRQAARDRQLFDVNLSAEARFDLERFVRQEKLDGVTQLTLREVRCRFENSTVPERRQREEVVNQFHPLVRFVASRLNEAEERRRPAVTVRLPARKLRGRIGPGTYGFSVQRWSVRGLRHAERLFYAAVAADGSERRLAPQDAELLVVQAASRGSRWLGAGGSMDPQKVAERIAVACVEPSERSFESYVSDLRAENEDRADVLGRMAERRYAHQRSVLEGQLRRFMELGPERLVPATKGRLSALEGRAEHRLRQIEAERRLSFSPPETVCVGLIRVDSEEDTGR